MNEARVFLTVVDDSEEFRVALRFASLRARHHGGRVAMLRVMPAESFLHFGAVEELIREEQREEAERQLQTLAEEVAQISGTPPLTFVREGSVRDELLALIEEEPGISVLVLGAATGPSGPGPLVTHLATKMAGRLRLPITIVPGGLTDQQLQALT